MYARVTAAASRTRLKRARTKHVQSTKSRLLNAIAKTMSTKRHWKEQITKSSKKATTNVASHDPTKMIVCCVYVHKRCIAV